MYVSGEKRYTLKMKLGDLWDCEEGEGARRRRGRGGGGGRN